MESFAVNTTVEMQKKSPIYGVGALFFEIGMVFIIVVNVIFFLNYFKVINIASLVGNQNYCTLNK